MTIRVSFSLTQILSLLNSSCCFMNNLHISPLFWLCLCLVPTGTPLIHPPWRMGPPHVSVSCSSAAGVAVRHILLWPRCFPTCHTPEPDCWLIEEGTGLVHLCIPWLTLGPSKYWLNECYLLFWEPSFPVVLDLIFQNDCFNMLSTVTEKRGRSEIQEMVKSSLQWLIHLIKGG